MSGMFGDLERAGRARERARLGVRRLPAPGLALALVLAWSSVGLSEEGPDSPEDVRVYVINGQPVEGTITKQDDDGFSLRMNIGGVETDVKLPWSALARDEVARIRGDKATSPLEKLIAQGADLIRATRYHFKNTRTLVGLEIKHKSTARELVIRTRHAPEFRFLRKEVQSTEPVMFPETEFYTLAEIYQRKKAEINPEEDARRHFQLAEYMMKVHHWAKAKDHFERARLLDERFEESAGQKVAEVDAARIDAEVRRLDQMISTDMRAERWVRASRKIRTLSALDPNSYIRTKWEAQLPQIEEQIRKTLRRSVVNSYYRKMDELLRNWVWGRIAAGGEIPGVVVTMRGGEAMRGKLVSDDEEFVVLENKGRTVKIAKDMVAGVTNVNLNTTRRIPGFADSKQYIEDTAGGMTATIVAALVVEYKDFATKQLPIEQKLIEDFWKDRVTSVVVITREGREQTVPVCSMHSASYGTGTWLREGAQAGAAPAPGAPAERRRANQGTRGNRGNQAQNDPEKWWKTQPGEVRYQVLRAIAAEALCEVDKVIRAKCARCGGAGGDLIVGASAEPGRLSARTRACPVCRGTGFFIKLRYR